MKERNRVNIKKERTDNIGKNIQKYLKIARERARERGRREGNERARKGASGGASEGGDEEAREGRREGDEGRPWPDGSRRSYHGLNHGLIPVKPWFGVSAVTRW